MARKVARPPDRRQPRAARFQARRTTYVPRDLPPAAWPDRLRFVAACCAAEREAGRPTLEDDIRTEVDRWRAWRRLESSELTGSDADLVYRECGQDWAETGYAIGTGDLISRHPWLARTALCYYDGWRGSDGRSRHDGDQGDDDREKPINGYPVEWGLAAAHETAVAWALGRGPTWVSPLPRVWPTTIAVTGLDGTVERFPDLTTTPPAEHTLTLDANDVLTRSPAELLETVEEWRNHAVHQLRLPRATIAVPEDRGGVDWIDLLARRVVLGESFATLAQRLPERSEEPRYRQPVARKLKALAKRLGVELGPFTVSCAP